MNHCFTAAFLIPYIVMLIAIGMPMMTLEMFLGQFTSSGPLTSWSCVPIFKGNLQKVYCRFVTGIPLYNTGIGSVAIPLYNNRYWSLVYLYIIQVLESGIPLYNTGIGVWYTFI